MSDISMGIHPRQQSARKQFTDQQVKYFYNSNIFAERPIQYNPSQFSRNHLVKETKNIKQTYSPQLSPRVIKLEKEIKPQIETDIITGLPLTQNKNSCIISSKPKTIKTETSESIQFDAKSETRSQVSPQKFTNLFFDNKKQYELWMKQNRTYENINYFNKNQDFTLSNSTNSYLKLHGKPTNQENTLQNYKNSRMK